LPVRWTAPFYLHFLLANGSTNEAGPDVPLLGKGRTSRIFFATDVHGSETCFRKFVNAAKAYKADAIILGGDITGKQLALIVEEEGGWRIGGGNDKERLETSDALEAARKRMRAFGMYPIVVTADEEQQLVSDRSVIEERFKKERLARVESWMALAAERLRPDGVKCFVSPGNDDDRDVAEIIDHAEWVENPEGKVVDLGGHEMISWGWSNPTPWNTPREQSEDELGKELTSMASQLHDPEAAIFNLHCPPHHSGLDAAPALDATLKPIVRGGQVDMVPVGSTAVRAAIERYQPMLGLHGHVHECRAMKRIGRSMCINPGSDYNTGTLRGTIVQLSAHKVDAWTLTTG
jgi:Icc-related predicted phosphoesterase